jgi:hypothetical protein
MQKILKKPAKKRGYGMTLMYDLITNNQNVPVRPDNEITGKE